MENTQKQVWQLPELVEADVNQATLAEGAGDSDGDDTGS